MIEPTTLFVVGNQAMRRALETELRKADQQAVVIEATLSGLGEMGYRDYTVVYLMPGAFAGMSPHAANDWRAELRLRLPGTPIVDLGLVDLMR